MNFVELSREKLVEENKKLFDLVSKDYDFDCVIFIARGSYAIGKDMAELKNVPLLEIFATRKGGKLKKIIRPLLQIIPESLKKKLREKEVNSNIHEKNSDRSVSFNKILWSKYKNCKKILIVDDSVDTGYSLLYVKKAVENEFKNSEVRLATLNCFKKSSNIIKTNYYIYEDTMLKGPWSNDSKENKKYLEEYMEWHNKQGE